MEKNPSDFHFQLETEPELELLICSLQPIIIQHNK